jgi:pimeloyl-ACP methyl ester carboxylesterase
MPHVLVNGVSLHYWQVGEGPDMVMIHGLTGNLAVWHFTTVPKLRHEYCITTYDLRGHGRSVMPSTGYTTRHMAGDLCGVMDALEIEKAHLMGHSLGADIALHFALLYPERVDKIVAIEAGIAALVHLRKRKDWPGWAEWAKALEKYGGIKVPREKWHDIDYMLRQSLKVPIVFGPARGLPRKKEKLLKLLDTTTLVKDYEHTAGMTVESLREVKHPVLLVYGNNSAYLGTHKVLLEALPNCTSVLLEDCEHFGPLERPDTLVEHTRYFLEGGERSVLSQGSGG